MLPSDLLEALKRPAAYPHAVGRVTRVDLGSSWLFLTGEYAYKISKPLPVCAPDCSSIVARRYACDDELRLNQRLAPSLYLDVVAIRGSPQRPRIEGDGPTLDYALRMRQFHREAVASRLLARGRLTFELIDNLGRYLAQFHASTSALERSHFGTPGCVYRRALHNVRRMERMSRRGPERESVHDLQAWTDREFLLRSHDLQARWESNRVREGHGDLRLDKLVVQDGQLVAFDCAAGRPELRWNDVMSEVATLYVDLLDHGAPRLAQLFLNAYLEESGDYAGLAVLRFYVVERALERAQRHLDRTPHAEPGSARERRLVQAYERALGIALAETRPQRPALVLMHGVPDRIRSALATALAQRIGAITLRHDIELRRMHDAQARAASPISGSGFEGRRAGCGIYDALAQSASTVLHTGYTAIVDAPFLRRGERSELLRVARVAQLPLLLLRVHPSEALLRAAHMAEIAPSRALDESMTALEHELATLEPVVAAEGVTVVDLPGERGLTADDLERIRIALDAQAVEESAPNATAAYAPTYAADTAHAV